jgi:acyl-CoA synthetase (AMP-forming)/AMP-acid ligase II
VPTVWSRVCAAPVAARQLRSARLLVSGSAPLPAPVFQDLVALTGQAPVVRYGMARYATGDVATIGADGWHSIVGRASTDLIKTGGYRVGAGEVEDVLLLHPAVREAAVIGTPHPDLGEQVTAYMVAERVAPSDLVAFVAERMATHKRPASCIS